jgi:hypothetical protein
MTARVTISGQDLRTVLGIVSDDRGDLPPSDFYSARQRHNTGMYCDYARPLGIEHHLKLCLPAGPAVAAGRGRIMKLMFFRGSGADFSERDRALLALLRPHLHQAYLDAERRRSATPRLTPPAVGTAAPGRRRAHQRPDRRAARRDRKTRRQAPGEHLRQAAGVQSHRRGHPRLPRRAPR